MKFHLIVLCVILLGGILLYFSTSEKPSYNKELLLRNVEALAGNESDPEESDCVKDIEFEEYLESYQITYCSTCSSVPVTGWSGISRCR